MAKEQLNDYTYGEMLVTPGYDVILLLALLTASIPKLYS